VTFDQVVSDSETTDRDKFEAIARSVCNVAGNHLSRYVRLVLIGIGSLATAIAVWEYRKVVKHLEGESFRGIAGVPGLRRVYPAVSVAVLLFLIGLLAFFTILVGAELPWPVRL